MNESGERVAWNAAEAARALGIGRRKLWEWTNRGLIPHVRIGRRVVYPVAAVEAWLEGRDYLCASRFTMADICVGYALYFANTLGVGEAMTPNVTRWWDGISGREAFKRASNS